MSQDNSNIKDYKIQDFFIIYWQTNELEKKNRQKFWIILKNGTKRHYKALFRSDIIKMGKSWKYWSIADECGRLRIVFGLILWYDYKGKE